MTASGLEKSDLGKLFSFKHALSEWQNGPKISIVRHVNDLFMKYSIPLALLAAVRTFAESVNFEFTVMLRSLIYNHIIGVNNKFAKNFAPVSSIDEIYEKTCFSMGGME